MSEPPENSPPNGQAPNTEAANEVLTPGMRLLALQTKHRTLDSKISEEFRPHADLPMDDYDATLNWARNNTASIHRPIPCEISDGFRITPAGTLPVSIS